MRLQQSLSVPSRLAKNILCCMNKRQQSDEARKWLTWLVLLSAMWLAMSSRRVLAQAVTNNGDVSPQVVLDRLLPPVYPPLARQALIMGDVHLKVTIHADGSIESVTPIDGHPMLVQAALDSARQSHFACKGCAESDVSQSITYSFEQSRQADPDPCCCSHDLATYKPPTQQVAQAVDHITVTGPPFCMCPDACTAAWAREHSKFRSAKCLYIWKCGHRTIYIY